MNWYLDVLKNKYAKFDGRARRKEFWMFTLFSIIASLVLAVIGFVVGLPNLLSGIYALAVLVPSIAIGVRRLHDIDRTGWWLLIALVPVIGFIVLLIFAVIEGQKGDNRFGPDPKAGGAAQPA